MKKIKLFGFTLNEVMITLGILGVVAALTMPTLNANIQSRKWNAVSQDFVRELEESLKIMNLKKVLAGYTTTKDFVSKLSEYIRIVKICNNDELQNCFADKVMWGSGEATPEEVDMTKVKQAKHFGLDDWGTELIGVQFANGVTGLVAYNPECRQEPLSNEPRLTECVSILYDTSGFSYPNAGGKDILTYGVVKKLGDTGCYIEIGGVCFAGSAFSPVALTYDECEARKAELGISYCCDSPGCVFSDGDSWAGAAAACGGANNLPSNEELRQLAKYLYNIDNYAGAALDNVSLDTDKAIELGLLSPGSTSVDEYSLWVWSNDGQGEFSGALRIGQNEAYLGTTSSENTHAKVICKK